MAQADIAFPKNIWKGDGVFTLNIGHVPTFSSSGPFGMSVPKNEHFLMCEAAAHVMDHQSGSQGYKTSQWVYLCLWFIFIPQFEVVHE